MPSYEFENGNVGERDTPWDLNTETYEIASARASLPCKHAIILSPVDKEYREHNKAYNQYLIRTVSASNQGGYDCVILCLDCILEAAASLPKQ
jgi:hypothetical protein